MVSGRKLQCGINGNALPGLFFIFKPKYYRECLSATASKFGVIFVYWLGSELDRASLRDLDSNSSFRRTRREFSGRQSRSRRLRCQNAG
jgi:hypothetical protein